jgi:hypothetical protein
MLPVTGFAARWVEVGNGSVPTDKVLVDADSIQKDDDITTVNIAVLYAAPRTNSHGITMDRHVQRTAFKCAERSSIGIVTTGYLGDKRVGSGGETADWKSKFVPIGQKSHGRPHIGNRLCAVSCGRHRRQAKIFFGFGIRRGRLRRRAHEQPCNQSLQVDHHQSDGCRARCRPG